MRTNVSVPQGGGRWRGRRAGFSLIELMAVLTIILVVVGLLSVALNQTRTRTMRVMCLDNMRQLQIAWLVYANDNNEHIALNKSAPFTDGPGLAASAPRHSTNSWVAGNPKEDRGIDSLAKGTLFEYTRRQAEIYRCPMDGSTTKSGTPRNRSYSIDAYLGGDDEDLDPRVKMRLTDIVNPGPEKTFVFIEEHENSIWASGFIVLPKEAMSAAPSSTASDRHMQGCNLTFVDGHLEYWKWLAPKKPIPVGKLVDNAKERSDLRRLLESVPKP